MREQGVYVDCTFGRGGHSRAILDRLGPGGRLLAFDRDPEAIASALQIGDPRFEAHHARFGELTQVLERAGVFPVDGVLLDLGVSSPQIDTAGRGFSFRQEGPLDMRMDTTRGLTAAQWLSAASQEEIGEVIWAYGEERFAKQIARAIVAARTHSALVGTRQLAQIVASAVRTREPGQDPATRTFQALRIFLNQELEELSLVLPQCLAALRVGGRLAVISFHSLEDRIVKRYLREQSLPEPVPARMAIREADRRPPAMRLVGRAVRASSQEVGVNPRARSASLRVAERLAF